MKSALAALSALVLFAGLGTSAHAGPRHSDRGDFVYVQDGYDGPDGRYNGPDRRYERWDRGDRRDGRGGWRDHGRPRFDRGGPELLPEGRIIRKLVRQGFVSIEDIRLRRDRYIVEATRPNGALVRLSVDAYDGEILSRDRIGWSSDGGGRRPGPGWGGREDFGGGRFGLYGR